MKRACYPFFVKLKSLIVGCVEGLVGNYNITFSFEGQTPFIKMSKSSENYNAYALHSKEHSFGSAETESGEETETDSVRSNKNMLGSSPSTSSLPQVERSYGSEESKEGEEKNSVPLSLKEGKTNSPPCSAGTDV